MNKFFKILLIGLPLMASGFAYSADRNYFSSNTRVITTKPLVMIGQRKFDNRPVTLLGSQDEKILTTERMYFTGQRKHHQ